MSVGRHRRRQPGKPPEGVQVGQTIHHRSFGAGKVKRVLNDGYYLHVEFPDMLKVVKFSEVTVDEAPGRRPRAARGPGTNAASNVPSNAAPNAPSNAAPNGPSRGWRAGRPVNIKRWEYSETAFKHRRIIEALRLGIVPYDCVDEFTIGRDQEKARVSRWLNYDSPEPVPFLLLGQYGTGKTHIVQNLRFSALKQGYAVASVEMDENPFNRPKKVYHRIIQSFRYIQPGDAGHFRQFQDFLDELPVRDALWDHRYFGRAIREGFHPGVLPWIEGYDVQRPYTDLPGMYPYQTAANIYCYLLSGLGVAAEACGLKGLLLIFDEAEAIETSIFSPYQAKKAENFLNGLLRTAKNTPGLEMHPMHSDLTYCGIGKTQVPFLYRRPCYLRLLFAFTPLPSIRKKPDFYGSKITRLEALSDAELARVFDRIYAVYSSAYQHHVALDPGAPAEVLDAVTRAGGRTRMFIKGTVEYLDHLRYGAA